MQRTSPLIVVGLTLVVGLVALAGLAAPAAAQETDDCSFPLTATDDTGTDVTIADRPDTIVTLDAASAQVLWEIGAQDRVVGMPVKYYTAYLEGSKSKTDVLGEEGTVQVETVVAENPDLVLAPNFTPDETIQQLRDAGLTVYRADFESSLDAIYAKTRFFGQATGECTVANRTVTEMREEVESIRSAVDGRERPRVLYYDFEYTYGNSSFIGEVVTAAGGDNVAAKAGIEEYGTISDEVIVEQDPEWIVSSDNPQAIDTSSPALSQTTAVQSNQTLRVDADLISQAGPRVVIPMRRMAATFHPEAVQGPNETAMPRATDRPDDVPGFGAGVAVLALVSGLLAVVARSELT